MKEILLNRMPAPTWNRLDINDITVQIPDIPHSTQQCGNTAITALGSEFCGSIGNVTTISGNENINIALEIGQSRGYTVHADKSADITVIMYITANGSALLRTFADVRENARLRLVQVIVGNNDSIILNDVGADISDSGKFDITQIFLGGKCTVSGVCAELNGYRSDLSCSIGYLLGSGELLDINNTVLHKGKKSLSHTDVKGVLSGDAKKTFRGTIDFRNGSSGAVGSENEDVLLMDENVVNKTVPVILCSEEDVEGAHGASIGRLDDDVIYYMTSRGIPEEAVYRIISGSRLEGLIHSIGDAETEERALEALERRWKNAAL